MTIFVSRSDRPRWWKGRCHFWGSWKLSIRHRWHLENYVMENMSRSFKEKVLVWSLIWMISPLNQIKPPFLLFRSEGVGIVIHCSFNLRIRIKFANYKAGHVLHTAARPCVCVSCCGCCSDGARANAADWVAPEIWALLASHSLSLSLTASQHRVQRHHPCNSPAIISWSVSTATCGICLCAICIHQCDGVISLCSRERHLLGDVMDLILFHPHPPFFYHSYAIEIFYYICIHIKAVPDRYLEAQALSAVAFPC